ncbi:MAG TPA: hypothetical protein VK789_22770 [Bryobacteraceae bacterium]|nr:hypothetical protein [Bryobacteraceae bacterium]
MFSKGLAAFGKAMLVTVAAGFGLMRALRDLDGRTFDKEQMDLYKARIDALDLAVARLRERADHTDTALQQSLTSEDLSHTLDQVFGKLERDVDARFERQARSVEALRVMVGQTDELLQKVLDGLESIRHDQDMTESR